MGFLEEMLYEKVESQFPSAASCIKKSWTRYLDDCWLIWDPNYGDDEKFFNILNSLNPAIKFTKDTNLTSLNFLDVNIYT